MVAATGTVYGYDADQYGYEVGSFRPGRRIRKGRGSNRWNARNGSFSFNANRELVTDEGYYVLGTIGDNIKNGVLTSTPAEVPLGDIKSSTKTSFPLDLKVAVQPTSEVKFYSNISVEDVTRVMSAEAVDPQNNKNTIRLEYTKAEVQVPPGTQWNIVATAQSSELVPVVDPETQGVKYEPAVIYDTKTGVVSFDGSESLYQVHFPH